MKTSKDPRHLARIKLMQELFSYGFKKQSIPAGEQKLSDSKKFKQILSRMEDIDNCIEESAPKWTVDKINHLDLAILRLAVFELIIEGKNPPKVVVDESVELAKEYGSEASPGFINGALGKLITDRNLL